MTATKTLYDILQIPRTATQDEIDSAYQLHVAAYEAGKLKSDNLDPFAQFNLIKDAHHTLASPALRARYDARLRENETLRQVVDYGNTAAGFRESGNGWKWACLVVLLVAGGGFYHLYEHGKAEKQQLEQEAEAARTQADRLAREQKERDEQEQIARAKTAQIQAQMDAARRQNEAIHYSENIRRNLATEQIQANRDEVRQRIAQDMQKARQANEASRRAALERAQISQIESHRPTADIIASPRSSSSRASNERSY